jgi:hypothetical protein
LLSTVSDRRARRGRARRPARSLLHDHRAVLVRSLARSVLVLGRRERRGRTCGCRGSSRGRRRSSAGRRPRCWCAFRCPRATWRIEGGRPRHDLRRLVVVCAGKLRAGLLAIPAAAVVPIHGRLRVYGSAAGRPIDGLAEVDTSAVHGHRNRGPRGVRDAVTRAPRPRIRRRLCRRRCRCRSRRCDRGAGRDGQRHGGRRRVGRPRSSHRPRRRRYRRALCAACVRGRAHAHDADHDDEWWRDDQRRELEHRPPTARARVRRWNREPHRDRRAEEARTSLDRLDPRRARLGRIRARAALQRTRTRRCGERRRTAISSVGMEPARHAWSCARWSPTRAVAARAHRAAP